MPSTGTHRPQSPDRGASAEATNGASIIAGTPTTTAQGKPVSDPSKDFAELVRRELKLSDRESDRVSGKRWLEQPPRSLFGLALSGGGIRSATFNLGLLQGLNEIGLLRGMDYLATVSGGGYIGGFWTRWRQNRGFPGSLSGQSVFPGSVASDGETVMPVGDEAPEILHLRRFSRFLAPAIGVFSFETGRLLVGLANAVLPSILTSVAFLVATALVAELIAMLVLLWPAWIATAVPATNGIPWLHGGAALCMFAFGVLHLLAMSAFWKRKAKGVFELIVGVLALVALSAIWGVMAKWCDRQGFGPAAVPLAFALVTTRHTISSSNPIWLYLFLPAAAAAALSVVNAFVRPVFTSPWRVEKGPGATALDRIASWFLFASVAWLVMTALWWIAFLLASNDVGGLIRSIKVLSIGGVPAAAIVTWLVRFVSKPRPGAEGRIQLFGRQTVLVASYLVVCALMVAAMLAVIWANQSQHVRLVAIMVTGLLTVCVVFYDPNRIGLHAFYRDRIVCAFLGAAALSQRAGPRTIDNASDARDDTEVRPEDDSPIDQLDVPDAADGASPTVFAQPLHLVVCAANDLTPRNELSSLSRGAASAVVSPIAFSVGDDWVCWREERHTDTRYRALPSFGAVLTASAAAFNTQMGAKSKALGPAVAFLMTSLGLRLGLWLRHPAKLAAGENVVRSKKGLNFFSELLGRSDARNGDWVFLSDGGHFDNTALYELIRRHCRYIVLSDCGQDSERAYDDLGEAVRRVRIDFDVDVRINLEPLKPDTNGLSRQPMVAGDIHYPDGDTGTLLVFKPTITGNEPPDVLQYKARNKLFPHQSTVDQFYDEAQWESYRRLGEHAVRTAFVGTLEQQRHPTLSRSSVTIGNLQRMEDVRQGMAQEFSTARREWFARPVDYVARLERVAGQLADLDAVLASSSARLIREVRWEIGDDVWAGVDASPPCPAGDARQEKQNAASERPLDANGASAPTRSPVSPTLATDLDAMSRSIGAIRRALITFEAIFLSENLATRFNEPSYLGLLNSMARWMRAPLMRTWWPLLGATCTKAFRTFAEAQFELSTVRADVRRLVATPTAGTLGLATQMWLDDGLVVQGDLSLHLEIEIKDVLGDATVDGGARGDLLSPRSVEVSRIDANLSGDEALMLWLARDLIVPPGLWGSGIGSEMLRHLALDTDSLDGAHSGTTTSKQHALRDRTGETGDTRPKESSPIPSDLQRAKSVREQAVIVPTFRAGTTSAKKDSADVQQLYVQAAFEVVNVSELDDERFVSAYQKLFDRWSALAPFLPSPDDVGKPWAAQRFVLLRRVAPDAQIGVRNSIRV